MKCTYYQCTRWTRYDEQGMCILCLWFGNYSALDLLKNCLSHDVENNNDITSDWIKLTHFSDSYTELTLLQPHKAEFRKFLN